jgi:hypothetical protein
VSTHRLRGEAHAAIYERFLYSDLSDKAVRLLCILDRFQNRGVAFPGRPLLAEKLGREGEPVSLDTVDRTLRELEAAGAIVTQHHRRPGGGRPMATYYVWPAVPEEPGENSEQSRTDADLNGEQSRTGAASSPQNGGLSPGDTSSLEQELINERDTEALCARLVDAVGDYAGDPKKRPAITAKWRKDMRLLCERGPLGRAQPEAIAPERVEHCIEFVFSRLAEPGRDGFCWAAQIRSPHALREHWDQMLDAGRRLAAASNGHGRQDARSNSFLLGKVADHYATQ